MAHLITVCHVCAAREPELTCAGCGRPTCSEHVDQDGVCEICWSEYGEWSAEQDEADREAMSHDDVYGDEPDDIDAEAAMEDEGMDDDKDNVCEQCGCEVASEADLDDGLCEICAAEGDDVLVDEDDDYIPGEDMDGDAQSALASCGWGTDEDYGSYGGEDF